MGRQSNLWVYFFSLFVFFQQTLMVNASVNTNERRDYDGDLWCQPGFYGRGTGICTACPAGKYNSYPGGEYEWDCNECYGGQYQDELGQPCKL